jgi:two-component system nitrogen regulation sensor histidine kinase NtrY
MKLRNMPLRTKLTLLFAFVAVLPLALTALLTSSAVSKEFRERTSREMSKLSDVILSELQRSGEDAGGKIARFSENLELKALLYRYYAAAGPAATSAVLHDLMNLTEKAARESGLDLLEVVDKDETILANYPDRARFNTSDRNTPALLESVPDAPALTYEEGVLAQGLSIKVARLVPELQPDTIVAGGFLVNDDFIARLPIPAMLHLVVVSPAEGRIYSSRSGPESRADPSLDSPELVKAVEASSPKSGDGELRQVNLAGRTFFVRELSLPSIRRRAAARFLVLSSTEELKHLLRNIRHLTLILLASGCLLSLLLGHLFAGRFTRPIQTLARGFETVAKGDLDLALREDRHDELGRLTEAFNRMTRDLKHYKESWLRAERIAAWQEMARTLAHEIKNPLSPIRISIETLQKTHRKKHPDFGKILEESTGAVLEEVHKLTKIVESFSAFARLPKPVKSTEYLREVIDPVLSLYAGSAEKYTIRTRLEPQDIRIHADPDQIHRVFINLIQNSMEAMPEGGEITIEAEAAAENGMVAIRFEDTGPGIPEEMRANLFRPYFSTKEKGTGLGMALSYRIITEHGGTMEADNVPGRGARFSMTLPRG